jgi:MFS family permease
MTSPSVPRGVRGIPGFGAFWTASTVSAFGSAVTTVAVPVLVVTLLDATPTEVGVVNAMQFLPYLLFGLVAGALIDRARRKPVLVWSSVGRAVLLAAIPILWATHTLTLWALASVLFGFGCLTLFGVAATQSFLPTLVPRERLLAANARLDQGVATAQTSGPAIGGVLVGLLGAPVAILADALSYLADAVLIGRIRVHEASPSHTARAPLRDDIAEGMRWTYRHAQLAPLAWSTHLWFLANSAAMAVLPPFALRPLGLSSFGYGLVLTVGGVGGLLGAFLAARLGHAIGEGGAIVVGRALYPFAWAAIALSPAALDAGKLAPVVIVGAGFALAGIAAGIENANEMGFRQAVTPDRLQGRVNATIRSANRTMAVVGSLAGGLVATALGYRAALWLVVGVFALAAAVVAVSPFRRARHDWVV